MAAAIRGDDPVVFFEHKGLFAGKGPAAPPGNVIPLGEANIVRSGQDVTIVALASTVPTALAAASLLAGEDISAEAAGLVRTLAIELAPVRVNSIHPGIVGDSPFWTDKPAAMLDGIRAGTLTGRLATMADIVSATVFLLENPSVNDVHLVVDGGWR